MSVAAPYAFVDAGGHEVMVLDETFTVLADIGDGQQTVMAETADFELAMVFCKGLRVEGIAADIEHERSTLDLTAAVDDIVAEWVSPLDDLAVTWLDPGAAA